ncbi:hypothetical protein ACFOPN_10395 [Xanthomonas hyacinthi]|uniref:hypothetical protein n=1 Tax=Xanthomonas hyacinthi TaxID=56455 RepID=UPI003609F7B6
MACAIGVARRDLDLVDLDPGPATLDRLCPAFARPVFASQTPALSARRPPHARRR